jgi:hypothetical protein
MNDSLEQLISIAKTFSSVVEVTKDNSDNFLVSLRYVSWKQNRNDCMSRSISGRGKSMSEACNAYLNEAKGKLLFGDSLSYYGKDAPMFICIGV